MAESEAKVEQYKAYLSKYFENPKEEKILYVFKKLDRQDITLEILQATGIGKVVNSFRKHEGPIGEKARQLVTKWKQLVSMAAAAPSSYVSEKEPTIQPGLQCETVSETTYGSHSGRVTHRLDEVVKTPYMDAVVKTEPSDVHIKEEPSEDKKSHSSEKSSRDKHQHDSKSKLKKRERSPENCDAGKTKKKYKHDKKDTSMPELDLSKVKKEKSENEMKVRVKKEPEDVPKSHSIGKEEKQSPLASPLRSKEHCDNRQNKDRIREGSVKSSSEKSSKSKDNHHKRSNSSTSSKTSSSQSSSLSDRNIFDTVRIKSEPKDKDEKHRDSLAKSSSSHKVKVKSEPLDNDFSTPDPDFVNVKVKTEPTDGSSKKSHRDDGHSHSKKQSSSKSTSSSERKSDSKSSSSSSRSKEKSSSKSAGSKDKHGEKRQSSSSSSKPSSSSSSKSVSRSKKPKPAVEEFDMFATPNGFDDDCDDNADGVNFEDALLGNVPKKTSKVNVKTEKPGTTYSISSKPDKSLGPARPTAKVPADSVPLPRKTLSLSQDEILGSLPEITPNYKPLPRIELSDQEIKPDLIHGDVGSKKNCRTLVYSGRRNVFLTSVPTLYNSCLQVLKDNVDALDYVGGVPYDILKPVFQICTPTQLYGIEDSNPQFIGETDELWKEHCRKDFRSQKPDEFESWREMYIRCHDARDAKLKNLTASISASIQKAKAPVRTTKLAYVDTVAKAPRDVARRQRMHGTAGPAGRQDPLEKLSSHRVPGKPLARPPAPRGDPNTSTSLGRNRSDRPPKLIAPMMRKTLRFMKSLKRK